MPNIISKEDALNYEIFSSRLTNSWIRNFVFPFFYRRTARKYNRYLKSIKLLSGLDTLKHSNHQHEINGMIISLALEKIKDDNPLGNQIKKLARNNKLPEALKLISQTAKVNRHMAVELCGEELLLNIENYLKNSTY